jgi:hypothetical protein
MTDPGYMLSEQAIRKIVDDHRRLAHEVYQLKQELASTHRVSPWPRELFWGKTVDGGETYPTNGNTFWVQLIDRTFDEAAGTETVTDTIGGDPVSVRAHTVDDTHIAEDTIVRVEKRLSRQGWRYWIVPDVVASPLLIRNDSGANRNRGETLEVTGVVSTPIADTNEVLKGELRAIEAVRGIILDDIASTATGPFAIAGLVYAVIDILDADHTHCYAKSSDANPQSNFGGPWRIVAKPTGTGNAQACLLLLGDGCYERKIKTAAKLTAGSSASCDFYVDGSFKGQETVYFNWMENGIASIASGKEGVARWFDDEEKWIVVASEC